MTEGLTGYITMETRGYLFLIGINRPAKRNAFEWSMLQDLSAAFTSYERDAGLRCAVVFAHGEHFTAGLDLADVDGESVCCRASDDTCPECGYAACTEITESLHLRPSAVLGMLRYW